MTAFGLVSCICRLRFDWDALAGGFFPPPWQPDAKALWVQWEKPNGKTMGMSERFDVEIVL